MKYTHNIVKINEQLKALPYSEAICNEYDNCISVSMKKLPKLMLSSINFEGLTRIGIAKSTVIQLWDSSQNNLYIKSDWNTINDIIFSPYRTDEDIYFLYEILPLYWAMSNKDDKSEQSSWRRLFKLIQE